MLSKKDFPIFRHNPKLYYLDAAATAQIPGEVLDVHTKWYLQFKANVHRGIYDLSDISTKLYESSRENIAAYFGVTPKETVLVKNATDGINLIATGLCKKISSKQSIVISELEHHSNLLPWLRLANTTGAALKVIPQVNGFIDLDKAQELIDKTTAVVAITHGSNILGTIQPIKKLASLAHQFKASIIVDGSQVVPHQPVKPWDLDCDAYVFSGHKAYSPNGSGIVLIKSDLAKQLEPMLLGGDMVQEVTFKNYTLQPLPWRFEGGTPNPPAFIGLSKGLSLLQNWPEQIAYEANLLDKLRLVLHNNNMIIYSPESSTLPLISFSFPNLHPHDAGSLFNEHNIALRTGFMCAQPLTSKLSKQGVIRASIGLWNNQDDIIKLDQAIKHIKKTHKL